MTDTSISELRKFIDETDGKIIHLLNERAKTAIEIGRAKGQAPVYDPEREGVVLDKINRLNAGPLPKGSLEEIYAAIMTACREIQMKADG